MDILKVPQGEFQLSRYPVRKKERLRAWDAADEYLLNYFHDQVEHNQVENNQELKILVVNDHFAAISTVLAKHQVSFWTDSWLTQQAFQNNFKNNNLSFSSEQIIKSTQTPDGQFDVILIKIPKSHALLEDQLIRIKPLLSPTTQIIAAGMVKAIHTSTLKLFEKYIGLTKTSLAKKKARLIFCKHDENIQAVKNPYPKSYILEGLSYNIINHANVFSREKLDIGTRFFLEHIPQNEKYEKIIDLGCGNGLVGLIAAEKNPAAEMIFLDESFMAVESAKENYRSNLGDNRKAEFKTNDCLTGIENSSIDLILNNPPFHQNNAIGDDVAWKMFQQSKKVLKKNGELWVIGNRHLGYHIKLKKLFGNCETIAGNKKFVILKTVKN